MDNRTIRNAKFDHNGVTFLLQAVDEEHFDAMIRDPETGMDRWIEGYPAFFTPSGRLYPVPVDGVKVEFEYGQ